MRTNSSILRNALLAAGALTFMTVAANAQGYNDPYNDNAIIMGNNENVEIAVPRYRPENDKLATPDMQFSLSQNVSYADLNLRTRHGAWALRSRVKLAARMLCKELDLRHPITASDSPPCYQTAAYDALYRADRAIAEARGYASNEY